MDKDVLSYRSPIFLVGLLQGLDFFEGLGREDVFAGVDVEVVHEVEEALVDIAEQVVDDFLALDSDFPGFPVLDKEVGVFYVFLDA